MIGNAIKANFFLFIVGFCCIFSAPPTMCPLPLIVVLGTMMFFVHKLYLSIGFKTKNKIYKDRNLVSIFFLSTGYFVSQLHWSIFPLFLDKKFYWLIPFSLSLIPLIHSLILLGITVILTKIASLLTKRRNGVISVVTFSTIWFLFEMFRKKLIFTGFPWHPIGSIFAISNSLSQISRLVKIDGLNFLTAFYCGIFYFLIAEIISNKKITSLFCVLFLVIIAIPITLTIYGAFIINNNTRYIDVDTKQYNQPNIKILTIQPSIPIEEIFEHNNAMKNLEKIINITNECLVDYEADIVIWPEGSIPYHHNNETNLLTQYLSHNLHNGKKYVLLSGTAIGNNQEQLFNAMIGIEIDEVSKKFWQYNKQILVPYGEYIPLQKYMPSFLESVTGSIASFDNSQNNQLLRIDKNGISLFINPLICYESIFSDHPNWQSKNFYTYIGDKKRVTRQRSIAINISNDGWLMNSIGVYQHALASKFRAIENNQPLIRVANSGVGNIYDNVGNSLASIEPKTAGCIRTVIY